VSLTRTGVDNKDGEIIIPPGGNFIVFFPGAQRSTDVEVAFGWWENKIKYE